MAEVYRLFAGPEADLGDEAAQEMYLFESQGAGQLKSGLFTSGDRRPNGFAVGKHWMDAQVKMWHEGLGDGTTWVVELYQDPRFPRWWLDRVLPAAYVAGYGVWERGISDPEN